MTTTTTDMPRWFADVGDDEKWEQLQNLLRDGWDTSDILRVLELPESKKRSLQVYARKFGPRRRLERFEEFKEALVKGAAQVGPDFIKALSLVASHAVSPDVKPSTQRQACILMTEFAKMVNRVMADEVSQEQERQRKESGEAKIDPAEAVKQILEAYGKSNG